MKTRLCLFASMLVTALLASVSGGSAESVHESEFVGAAQCAQCHQAAYTAWQATPHARALDRLSEAERQDPRCRQCHTTAPEENDAALAGVQCESCHGRGKFYTPRYVMKDPQLRQVLYFEQGNAETCARCHNDLSPNLTPFVYEEKLKRIYHGPPPPLPPTAETP